MQSWFHFCNDKVAAIEKVWNQKLDRSEPEPKAPEPEEDDSRDAHEKAIEEMLSKLATGGRVGRPASAAVKSKPDANLVADILADREEAAKKESKDDTFKAEKKTGEFGDNQFWKQPE